MLVSMVRRGQIGMEMDQTILQLGGAADVRMIDRRAWPIVIAALAGVMLGLALVECFPAGGRGSALISRALPEPQAAQLPRIRSGRAGEAAPLVVIDAGHGGFDPGASGPGASGPGASGPGASGPGASGPDAIGGVADLRGRVVEKDLVLPIALALRDRLLDMGALRVALTREDDRFLALEERVSLAEALEPDLFLSIHADSAPVEEASGANVYVLSARASDAAAMALARAFNTSDEGAAAQDAGLSDVEAILAELARRETTLGSARIARRLEERVGNSMPIHGRFRRGADLVVLRSARMPSLLFEAGYITNPDDAARVASPEGRAAIVDALADAITAGLLAR